MKLRNKLLLSYLGAWSLTVLCASAGLRFGLRIYDEFQESVSRLENLDSALDSLQLNIDEIGTIVSRYASRREPTGEIERKLNKAFENLEAALVDFESSVRLQPKDYQVMYPLQMQIQSLVTLATEFRRKDQANARSLIRKALTLSQEIGTLVRKVRSLGVRRLSSERALSEVRIDGLLHYYFYGVGLVLLFAFGLAFVVARHFAQPLQRLIEAVTKVRERNFSAMVPESSRDEFGTLGAAFNGMLLDLRASLISRTFVERILDSLPDAVLVVEDGALSFVNAQARSDFKLPATVVRGTRIESLPALAPLFVAQVHPEGSSLSEVRLELEPSNERTLLLSRASFGHDSQGMVVAAKDISSLRATEREIEGYRERLRSTTQLAHVGMVGAMLAHQLHQPLSSIKLFLQQMLRTMKSREEEQRMVERLELCVQEVDRMHEKVKESLLRTRDSESLPREPVDCLPLCRRITALFRSRAEEARLTIKVSCESEQIRVVGSEIEVEELMYLLVQNAIQAAPQTQASHLEIRLRDLGSEKVQLCFEDSCGGMSEEMRKNLFKPFASGKGLHEGIGLGMALVHQVVTKLQGTISVESVEGRGTEVTLELPRA